MLRLSLCLVAVLGGSASAAVDPGLIDTIKKTKPADFPSANTVTVVADQDIVFQADGQFTATIHTVRLVLTPSGKAAAASRSFDFVKDAEKMEVLSAQVIKADGQVVPISPASIKETEQSGDMNIYDPNGRSMKVTFEGLSVGDAIDITARLTRFVPIRTGFFSDTAAFQGFEPMLEASYRVDGPASLPLFAELYHPERAGKIEESRTKQGDRIHYAWSARNVEQIVPEALMNATTELPMLVVTTDPSWEHFSSWWAQVAEPQMEITDDLKQKVAELTRDAKSEAEKIKALYNFVATDIRYRGLGVGPRTGYTPRKAEETYLSRWGVCRDVAILLAAMLRNAGFEAHPVLTNVGDPVLPKAAYDGFNHAIVAMPAPGGGWTFLDPTAKFSSDLLPGNEREQSVLVATAKGETLGTIPAGEPSANLGRAVAQSTVGADGALTATVKIETKGVFDLVLRSVAGMMPAERLRQLAAELVHAVLPDAKLVSFDISSPIVMWSPMSITFKVEVPNATLRAGNYLLLRTLVTSGALGVVHNLVPQVLGALPTRKYTLDAKITFQWDEDETVTVPAGTRVLALPNDVDGANGVSALSSRCKQTDPTTLRCQRTFQLKSRFIDPGQYTELRSLLGAIGQVGHQPVILGRGGK